MAQTSAGLGTDNAATLILSNGVSFNGFSFGAKKSLSGEAVFQTGMVGYVESLTDPSYSGQILVLSFPMIGNYGVPPMELTAEGVPKYFESHKIHVAGLVVADYSFNHSHWLAQSSLGDWLKKHDVPAVYGVDTRALIKILRQKGSMLGKIIQHGDKEEDVALVDQNSRNLVAEVSTKQVTVYGKGEKTICVVDCGMKANQLRCFIDRGLRVKVVPWDYDFSADEFYDGLFLSNGPGDPTMCAKTIETIQKVLARESARAEAKPVFGICLGNQLLGLAAGAKTYKLKFGNRGQNQPCIDMKTGRCHLTMQNHGFAIDSTTLPAGWKEYFVNANDKTNEGIFHESKPFFSVQFHPEARGGPNETEYLFDYFISLVNKKPFSNPLAEKFASDFVKPRVGKVLILGSGGLSIGQAGEFDYSGSQAIKALKEENIKTVLINPNIATIQTTPGLADKVYFLPVTPEWVSKVIEVERPDGIFLQFGGQTALNCGVELHRSGILAKHNVMVLGTSVDTIVATEDREIFAMKLMEINEKIAPSAAARSVAEALAAAEKIGYPVIVRAAFALGGLGSGFAANPTQLEALAKNALAASEQVLVEKSLYGWKEIEYEVVRDAYDNCITVCNMENFDPLGIHTGESIVVAPSQTLSDHDYHMLRRTALNVVRHLGVVGECNIQYALDPFSNQYYIIEVNARLSRSSALASKATGYPLAFIAAKLSLGYSLPELKNSVTKVTTACWEPSLDYCVVKIPRWDLKKFQRVNTKINTSMKSVGEVMAVGRRFEEALQKACRMVNLNSLGFQSGLVQCTDQDLIDASDQRLFAIAEALKQGYTIDRIHELTKIDKWFLGKLKVISDFDRRLHDEIKHLADLSHADLATAKKLGFSDKHIARLLGSTELIVRKARKEAGIIPFVKQIDTVAAEFPATNNYLYVTYNGSEDDVERGFGEGKKSQLVLGSGAYCIGSSVEFDWCAVNAIRTLSTLGYKTIMVNYNPETVSTDYDECDKLYFEELSFERVVDIFERESPEGTVVSMGGQIPNNVAMALSRHNIAILGTSADSIDSAENRYKFSRLLDTLGVDQPKWKECRNFDETKLFCEEVGYPCLVRPSFVLSGAGMNVVHSEKELEHFLNEATAVSKDHPVVISKFITEAKEIDVDAVAQNGRVIVSAVVEHIENAGVHSGDASLVLPAQDLDEITVRKIKEATEKIAKALIVTGPFNIQFIAKDNAIKVIECNLRASRSFPFVSKTLLVNFAEIATKVIVGEELDSIEIDLSKIPHVGVKVPQFSFARLQGADPVLGVEMASTGEVACFGQNKYEAFIKAMQASGIHLPDKNILVSCGSFKEKQEILPSATKLVAQGFRLFGTPGTADFLTEHGVPTTALQWPEEASQDDFGVAKHLQSNMIDLAFIMPSQNRFRRPSSFFSRGYMTRRLAVDYHIPLITNIKVAKMFAEALTKMPRDLPVSPVDCRSSHHSVILPGLIDIHVHLRDPGQTHKEDWYTGTASALAGGFTIVCAMPNTQPSIVDAESYELSSKEARTKAVCDYGIFVGASSSNAGQLKALAQQGAVALKMYLDQTFSTLQLNDLTQWLEHFKNWPSDLPLCVHAEKKSMAAALFIAQLTNRSVHVCHISLADEIGIIREAKLRGMSITCEVCPHHLFLSEEDIPRLGHGRCEVRPRLATKKDVEALWANMEFIDCIATDHAPHLAEEKDSDKPPPGFPGLETSLALMLRAVHDGWLTLADLIAKMHTNPKRIFRLPDQPNTYTEVDLDEEWIVPAKPAYSKCQWTPFAGEKVKGKVKRVVLRGEVVFVDGKIHAKPGSGKNVTSFSRPASAQATSLIAIPSPAVLSPGPRPRRPSFGAHEAASPTKPIRPLHASGAIEAEGPRRPSLDLERPADQKPMLLAPILGDRDKQSVGHLKGRDVLSVKQFGRSELHYIFTLAEDMRLLVKRMGSIDLMKGKVLANIFYEPSTRTSSSFAAAMIRLGGSVIPIDQTSSSVAKGETLPDTIKTMCSYCDVIALRHPQVGSAQIAAAASSVPILNAGDGTGEHPTQALLDVFTIRQELGTVNGLNVTLLGDLKHGRTVHSLVQLLAQYKVNLTYVAPPALRLPAELFADLKAKGVSQVEVEDLSQVLPATDVLYVTRVQKERFASPEEYEKVKGSYKVTTELLTGAKDHMIVMHPLPRVDEIHPDVDSDPRAVYFRQTENGLYIRMALLALVLGKV